MSKTNSVRLIGHVGQNPKLVSTSTENCVITVTLATNEIYRDDNGNKTTKTEWHNIVAFGRIANLFNQYVKKGDQIMLEGRLQTRQYLNKAQENRYITEIIAEEIMFLGSRKDKDNGENFVAF